MKFVELGELTELVMGQAPDGKDCNKEGVGYPFVKAGEFSARFPVIREWTTSPKKFAAKGDVLICVVGATAGKINDSIDCAIGRSVAAVRPNRSKLDHGYLYRFLQTKTDSLRMESQGLAQGVITREMINRIKIPLPPLEEQRRLAGILDQADALHQLRSRALDKLYILGQAVFHEMFGDLVANERGFEPVVVGDVIGGFETGKNLAGDPDERRPDGFRVLKISAVTSGIFKSEESKPLPPNYEPPESHIVRDGDLLFSRANTAQLIGATAFARTNSARLVLPDKLWRFVWKRKSKVLPEFVKALFSSPSFRYEIGRRSSGTSGSMKNIGQQKVMTIPFGLPSIELQKEFATRLLSVAGQAEATQQFLETCENLFASLQHRAFRGEL